MLYWKHIVNNCGHVIEGPRPWRVGRRGRYRPSLLPQRCLRRDRAKRLAVLFYDHAMDNNTDIDTEPGQLQQLQSQYADLKAELEYQSARSRSDTIFSILMILVAMLFVGLSLPWLDEMAGWELMERHTRTTYYLVVLGAKTIVLVVLGAAPDSRRGLLLMFAFLALIGFFILGSFLTLEESLIGRSRELRHGHSLSMTATIIAGGCAFVTSIGEPRAEVEAPHSDPDPQT